MLTNIGPTIRAIRKERSLSQRDLGYVSGVSYSQLNEIEKGYHAPGIGVLERLCQGLGVPVRHFIIMAELNYQYKQNKSYGELLPMLIKLDRFAANLYAKTK